MSDKTDLEKWKFIANWYKAAFYAVYAIESFEKANDYLKKFELQLKEDWESYKKNGDWKAIGNWVAFSQLKTIKGRESFVDINLTETKE